MEDRYEQDWALTRRSGHGSLVSALLVVAAAFSWLPGLGVALSRGIAVIAFGAVKVAVSLITGIVFAIATIPSAIISGMVCGA